MIHWNPFAFAALFTAIASLWIGVNFAVYGKKKLHYLWACFNFAIFAWSFLVTLAAITNNAAQAYTFWNSSHGFGIFVSIFFAHTVVYFCNLKVRFLIPLSYLYGFIHLFVTFALNGHPTNDGVLYLFNSVFYLKTKPVPFLIEMTPWIILAIWGNIKLFQYYKKSPDKAKQKQAIYLLSGATIGYLGGISTFLPMVGLYNYYPITILGVGIYCLINTYAIFKDQFLELQVIYKKSIVYSFLAALVTIFYLLIVISLEKSLKLILGYTSFNFSLLIAFIVGLCVIPLKNLVEKIVDKAIFRKTTAELAEENTLLRQEITQTEKLRSIATLASGLAHEIRNPITAISTFAEYLPKKKDDPEFIAQCQRTLLSETSRINDLLYQLLVFAKPSSPAFQETNVNQVLNDVITLIRHRCDKQDIKIEESLSALETIKADPNQLKQAILNIILNAIEAMPKGGTLTIKSMMKNNYQIIAIKDTGTGITPKDLKQIFDPFFTKKPNGTGLGLAVTYAIIEQHKGKIQILSKKRLGTEFKVTLCTY